MPSNLLALGSSGPAVKQLQQALAALGVNPGPIDGVFGPKTEAAVKRFQKRVGGVSDGIVGPKTRQAMKALQEGGGSVARPKPPVAVKPPLKPVVKPVVKPAPKPASATSTMAARLAAAKPVPKPAPKRP